MCWRRASSCWRRPRMPAQAGDRSSSRPCATASAAPRPPTPSSTARRKRSRPGARMPRCAPTPSTCWRKGPSSARNWTRSSARSMRPSTRRCASPTRAPGPSPRRSTATSTPTLLESWGSRMPEINVREAIRQAIVEEMERDERVFIMGEDIDAYGGSYAVTAGLAKRFGKERVRDTPISETVIVGAGCGAAMGGLRPIVELMTINFSLVAMDQIINNAAKIHSMFGGQINVPLVIRAPAGWTQLSATHSQSLEAWLAHTPGLKEGMPSTPYDHKGLLKSSVRDPDPVMYIQHTLLYSSFKSDVPDGVIIVPIGQSDG